MDDIQYGAREYNSDPMQHYAVKYNVCRLRGEIVKNNRGLQNQVNNIEGIEIAHFPEKQVELKQD